MGLEVGTLTHSRRGRKGMFLQEHFPSGHALGREQTAAFGTRRPNLDGTHEVIHDVTRTFSLSLLERVEVGDCSIPP